MSDETTENGSGKTENGSGEVEVLSPNFTRHAVMFVINAHAATVNMRLYPPTSSMVTDTLEKADESLKKLFDETDTFSVSAIERSLLINDVRLEEIEQQKVPVKAFLAWMDERGLSNIEFNKGVTTDELRASFETIGEILNDPNMRVRLADELDRKGVENVLVNQRIYVAIAPGEEIGVGGSGKATPLDALKDELLVRYLMNKVDLGDVEDQDVAEILSNPGKVGGLMSSFLVEEGAEGGVLIRSQQAEDALDRLSIMTNKVEDESMKAMLSEQITKVIAEMSPREMTGVLSGHGTKTMDIGHVRSNVIKMLNDAKLMDIVDSLMDEYAEMKMEAEELDTEWARERLKNLNELLLEVKKGKRGEEIAEKIDRKLDEAGIEEERDPHTGKRMLSVCQMLGGRLEEEDVDLGEGLDQTVSRQVRKLYGMEESDLAAGILLKLAGNLNADSDTVRRYAASLIKQTLEDLEPGDRVLAADVLQPRVMDRITTEKDYQAYITLVDSLATVAEVYVDRGRAEEASGIVELLGAQATSEGERGVELTRYASAVLETLMGSEGILDPEELLLEDDDTKRLNVLRALVKLGPGALAPLVGIVKDRGHLDLRDRALEALECAGPVGVEALLAELRKENKWYIYRNVLNVIAELKLVEAVEEVSGMVSHPDERIKREAVRSLARIGSADSLSVVLAAANDQSTAVRRTAIRVLGMFGDKGVAGQLLDIINDRGPLGKDEDQGVREAACLALGDLHDSALIPDLGGLLSKGGILRKGKPDEIRAAVCIALGNIGDSDAIPLLEKVTNDSSIMVSSSADKALRKLRGEITSPEKVGEMKEFLAPDGPSPEGAAEPPAQQFFAPEEPLAETTGPLEAEPPEPPPGPQPKPPLVEPPPSG
ncbi:MAG: HEAT repeat domain-containing protein, partial [Actinobacteria bacterium]|nr:HEAT repeat domain-containing protein [Actinomycetota bacterium]